MAAVPWLARLPLDQEVAGLYISFHIRGVEINKVVAPPTVLILVISYFEY